MKARNHDGHLDRIRNRHDIRHGIGSAGNGADGYSKGEGYMSRVKDTIETIEYTKSDLYGKVEKPVLYLLPMLAEIAIPLAVIADSISAERRQDG